jgi:hypothetical protein
MACMLRVTFGLGTEEMVYTGDLYLKHFARNVRIITGDEKANRTASTG